MEAVNSNQSCQDTTIWGDDIGKADENDSLRIIKVNMNGLPKHSNHPKYGILQEAITKLKADVIGLSEINVKWDRMYPTDRLRQRVARWWENSPHCSYAYNYRDLSKAVYQPGGTAILSLGGASSRVLPHTLIDGEGLGRWTSTIYNGKRDIKVRIVQVYCPALPSEMSNNSVYAQHHRYFLTKNNTECPRKIFFSHLHRFISERLQSQEQLIIMGDFNYAMDSRTIASFQSSLNLHNIHKSLHNNYHANIPTHDRGSKAIDAIFATPGIVAPKGGYLAFQQFPMDHRAIWCDIKFSHLFGHNPPTITPPPKRRLKCEDPRVVSKFCDEYIKLIQKNDLYNKVVKLNKSITDTLTKEQQKEYELLDKQRISCALEAERKCRKFKTGGVEYSPKMQHQRDRITLWRAVLSRKNGKRVHTRFITRLEKRINVSNSLSYSIEQIREELTDAFQLYKDIKNNGKDSSLRDEWYDQLAEANAQANNTTFAAELKNKRQKEKQKQMFRAIKWTLKENNSNPAISEVTELINGEEILLNSKDEVENSIIKANDQKYRQTNDTPLMTDLLPDVGFLGDTLSSKKILDGEYIPCQPVDKYTRAFMKELKRVPNIPQISIKYILQQIMQ